jgi:transcriptional regulator of acetoin/glycerol metabolism
MQRLQDVALPTQPFFSTPQQRLALARQRYFDEGVRPSGLVNEGVIQSWSRCVQGHRDPVERIAFNPVTPSRVHSALSQSQLLLKSAAPDLEQLEHALAGTSTTAILTDANGVVVHSTRTAENPEERLLPLLRRVGVSLDEEHIGTGAPGISLRTRQPCTVLGGEHYFSHMQGLHCAAAPIMNIRGQLAAVLDVTCESRPFGFDAAAIVSLYATTIENQLLQAQSTEHIVVHLQTSPALLATPLVGLAGLDASGRIAWLNGVAARLLGVKQGDPDLSATQVLAMEASRIANLTRVGTPTPHRLPSGLAVWIAARMQARDGAARPHALQASTGADPAAAPAASTTALAQLPGSLRDCDRHLVAQTVQACGGNVSRAARKLGVSRGLIYRHLRQAKGPAPA